ncbi:hypothetical protein [Deinococcus aestuarii]|uniref:hypothetical protein n=1 Tax=Deinococcus aestuarii TaxID=2774531 RepID=UPI001C0AEBBE|nr:hypothetical protein [Deinococcus aestuarii]
MPPRDFLERRNTLWARLRELTPGTPDFGATLAELSSLIGWERERVLAGLGLTPEDAPPGREGA